MRFAVKDTLTEEEIQKGLSSVIREGLATQTMVTLTGGVFLVAFALKLGASNLMIGLLAAIPPLAQLIQIPSLYLVEKYRVRRAITVYAAASSRIFWLFIALIPFLFSIEAGLAFLIMAPVEGKPKFQFPFSIVRTTFEKEEERKNRRNRQWMK